MRHFLIGFGLLAALAASTGPSLAQFANPDQDKVDKNTNEQVDQQYKKTLDKTRGSKPTGEAKVDPWSNMRGTDPAKPKK
jgi:hypothetical protein